MGSHTQKPTGMKEATTTQRSKQLKINCRAAVVRLYGGTVGSSLLARHSFLLGVMSFTESKLLSIKICQDYLVVKRLPPKRCAVAGGR